jgi:SAM-dependent methyltransferase
MSSFYERFLKYIKNKDAYILDLGCGPGRDLLFFKKKGYRVLGIDNSEKLIEFAKKYSKADALVMDFREMDFTEEFDAIWASASLLHLKKHEITSILKSCYKALKKDGIMYASFKYGDFNGLINGRYFAFMTEDSLKNDFLKDIKKFKLQEIWKSKDLRKNKDDMYWLNAIFKKD